MAGSGGTMGNHVLQALRAKMLAEPEESSLLSDYTKGVPMDDAMKVKRYEMTIEELRSGSQLGPKQKQTPRAPVFNEQLRLLEEKTKRELSILEDIQEFTRARASLEMEHALNLQRLAQQFHGKRKWPELTYSKGHDSILLIDIWRSVISLTMDDAKGLSTVSENLMQLTNERFEQHIQQKRTNYRTSQRILERLQDELFGLDAQVAETKGRYDTAVKQFNKMRTASRKRAPNPADIRKSEASCEFARHQYLLELAAANGQYAKFRNEQLPEVMDAVSMTDVAFASNFFKGYTTLFGKYSVSSMKNLQRVDQLASIMSPELERRSFLHTFRSEFPGRQLFERERESTAQISHSLTVDDPVTRHTLVKMRGLLMHTCRTIDTNQSEREKQMRSLQSLLSNYLSAGSMFDAEQPKIVETKMRQLHSEIEGAAKDKMHLQRKLLFLSEAGIDEETVTPIPKSVLDLDEAQARESERRALTLKHSNSAPPRRRASKIGFKLRSKDSSGGSGHSINRHGSKEDRGDGENCGTACISIENSPSSLPSASIDANTNASVRSRVPPPVVLRKKKSTTEPTPASERDPRYTDEQIYEEPQPLDGQHQARRALAAVIGGTAPLDLPPPPPDAEQRWSRPRSTLLSPPPPPPPAEILESDDPAYLPPPPPHLTEPDLLTARSRRSWALDGPVGESMYENVLQAEIPPRYKALYPYRATQDDDITLRADERLYVLVVREDGWCLGINFSGVVGYFPASYVDKDDNVAPPDAPLIRVINITNDGSSDYGVKLKGRYPPRIYDVAPGSAAANAGLLSGDAVLEVAGEPCSDMDAHSVSKKLLSLSCAGATAKMCVMGTRDSSL